ncbi:helix-turn-helix transcriptional regulator [Gordonia sp. PDNC005]|uniref:helix-turn-helix transcriptional regulator n=1 Tax=Gordonia sp. PDNC005 TaxID=2811424 RepID=UPI0019661FAC|nr:helix-turn-helix transcriptional regulator [Gordonia sp. PDNC005]QRY61507.1 helix-turn-helix transcriptional regulator [Gordonia sp. PDNC005]
MEVRDPADLRRARKEKRLTQRELAFLVRRTHTTIYKLETGQLKNITEDLAISIAARLERPWEKLFIAHEAPVQPSVSNVLMDVGHTHAIA